jgi:FKBP-type peptidyl-prolyl cis-trans isomerase (trigger factor)
LEWQAFLKTHNLEASMSRRGNCYDNAVAESFFHLLKSERIRRKTYATREEARQDVFNYIEEKIKFELPESLVKRENEGLVANYIKEQGFKDEDEAVKKDKKEFVIFVH